MKKTFICFVCVLTLLTVAACSGSAGTVTGTVPPLPTEVASASSIPEATSATPSPTTPETVMIRPLYTLVAVLDYDKKRLDVQELIDYPNLSDVPLDKLLLIVEPNLIDGVFSLTSLTGVDGSPFENTTLEKQRLTLSLPEPLQPGESLQIRLTYSLYLPHAYGVLCFSDTQVNLSGWYAYIAPYIEGKGWISHDPANVGEYQVDGLADFQVRIRVDGTPDNFMLAASSKGTYESGWYTFNQTDARNFTWSGSSEYHMLEAYAGEVRVRAFVFPYDLAGGQASLDATVQALNLYSELFGPYGHDSLTIVEASFGDGMEYDGLYYLGQEYFNSYKGSASSYLTTISVHETSHQWWYGMITNDQAEEPWLDEALATYSELLYYENVRPDLVNWWWQTRIDAFYPQGKVDITIYDRKNFRLYVNAVYLRGASFLGELSNEMGEEAFLKFLHDYFTAIHARAAQDQLGLATSQDFWNLLDSETNVDYSAIKSEYFSQP